MEKEDLELIREFQRGNQHSFEELVGRYTAKAFSLAHRLTKNQQDAEEVLQDVFVTVYRKIGGFEGKSSFSSWLYRVTVNAALMKLRKRRQDRCLHAEDVTPEVEKNLMHESMRRHEGDAHAIRHQISGALEAAIARLPDEYRPVFVLRDIDGLSSKEVSKILQITVPAVKSRLHRSRTMLRRKLGPFYRDYAGLIEGKREKSVGNL